MKRIRAVIAALAIATMAVVTLHASPASDQERISETTDTTLSRARSEGTAILAGIRAAQVEEQRIKAEQEAARLAEEARQAEEARKAEEAAQAAQKARERARSTTSVPRAAQPVSAPSGDVWAALRQCESGGNYRANTGNGYYGAYQFSASTWRSMGTGYAYAHEAPPAVQDDAARRLQARSGWGQWPACSRKLGLR